MLNANRPRSRWFRTPTARPVPRLPARYRIAQVRWTERRRAYPEAPAVRSHAWRLALPPGAGRGVLVGGAVPRRARTRALGRCGLEHRPQLGVPPATRLDQQSVNGNLDHLHTVVCMMDADRRRPLNRCGE